MSQSLNLTRHEYGVQDAILQYISSNFVSIKESEEKFYKEHLDVVVQTIIEGMKTVDPFFNTLFQRDTVAGSFWDGLKVGKPVEFDKNFVLKLPSCLTNNIQFIPASPSFVLVNVQRGLIELQKSDKWEAYRKIENWLDRDGNIISDSVRSWMEGVIVKAVKSFPEWLNGNSKRYCITARKSGPAMTLEVTIFPDNKKFDIDVVPAFEFHPTAWPKHVKEYPANVPPAPWHLVPKPIQPTENKSRDGHKYLACLQWRLSFHNQESYRIYNTFHLKAVLKLIKKMRDVKDQNLLSSYAIKTVFLWEMDVQDDSFWKQSLSVSFLHMLNVLNVFLKSGRLHFYWQEEHNLLEKLKPGQRDQLSRTFQKIQDQIYYGLQNQDWFIIAKEILTEKEYLQIQDDLIIEKSDDKVVARLKTGVKDMAQVKVKCMNGKTLDVSVNPRKTSVGDMKRIIHQKTGISYERQHLLHQGRTMTDSKPLHYYNVQTGSIIQMAERCSGG